MIKKFKIFEKEIKYNIGDYILFNWDVEIIPAIIIDIAEDWDYIALTSKERKYFIYEDYIIRKLNKKEINKFEIERQSKKYNL